MLKAIVQKEVTVSNKEIVQYLWVDGSFLENIDETLVDMLYTKYDMDYATSHATVDKLTNEDYIEILQSLADRIAKHGMV